MVVRGIRAVLAVVSNARAESGARCGRAQLISAPATLGGFIDKT